MNIKRRDFDTQKYREIGIRAANNISAMLAYWDKSEICRFANTAYLEWFGKTQEEMVDKMSLKELLGSLYEKNLPYIKRALHGENQHFEREITIPSGEVRYSLATYTPEVVNNEVLGFIAHVTDITSNKKMEISHSQLEKKFRNLIESTPDALVIVDESGTIQLVNQQLENIFGYSKSEIIGQSLELLLPERFKAKHGGHMRTYFKSPKIRPMGGGVQLYARRKNGEEFPVEISLSPIESSEGLQIAAAFRDTTDRVASQAKLKEISNRLKLATHYSSIGIWEYDVVKNVLAWDDIMFQLYGVQKEHFSGAYDAWKKGLHPDDRAQAERDLQMAILGQKEFDTEFRVVWTDQTVHFIKARAMVQRDASGSALCMLGTNWDITNQKIAEAEIRQSNQRNRIFVEQAPRAMAMFDKSMCYMAASQQWIKDYNLSGKQIIGHSHYEIFPEIGEDWKQIHRECLQGAINQYEEAAFERADGSLQWITWDVRPWYVSEGNIGGLIMYTADITQLKQKDQEKRRTDEILDKTNEVARIGTWEVDLKADRVLWSRITREIHEVQEDFEPDFATAINFFKPGESQSKIQQVVKEAIETGASYDVEIELVTARGNIVWVRAIGQAEFEKGKCKRLYGVFHDINERKVVEEKISQLASIIEFSKDGMISKKTDGTILTWNKGAEEILGYTSDEIVGKNISTLFPEELIEEEEDMLMLKINADEYVDQYETARLRKDNVKIPVSITLSPIKDKTGKTIAVSKIIRDISEKKEAERKLINYSILESKSKEMEQFAYVASHDLREPLLTMKNYIELLIEDYSAALDDDAKQYAQSISGAANRMDNLIRGLLDYSRLSKMKELQEVDCNKIVKEVQADLHSIISSSQSTILANRLPLLKAYPLELKLLFQNLISNAIKFKRSGVLPIIHISSEKIDDGWQFKISDNGIGIDERDTEKIFVIFQRLHSRDEFEGTGIGLAHCKKIAEIHGGKIWVDSKPGTGSDFYFTIQTESI